MKMKVMAALFLLVLTVGIACAADVNNMKMPDGWEATGSGNYHEIGDSPGAGSGRNLMIMEYNDANCGDFFDNGTDNYYIFKNSDGSYNFTDWVLNNDEGCFEVVDIDGKQYFVLFSCNIDKDYQGKLNIYETMLEFNKLNNLKPVEV